MFICIWLCTSEEKLCFNSFPTVYFGGLLMWLLPLWARQMFILLLIGPDSLLLLPHWTMVHLEVFHLILLWPAPGHTSWPKATTKCKIYQQHIETLYLKHFMMLNQLVLMSIICWVKFVKTYNNPSYNKTIRFNLKNVSVLIRCFEFVCIFTIL